MSFIQTPPVLGNQWDTDRVLQSFLRRRVPSAVLDAITPSLARMGGRAVGDLGAASAASYGEEPELVQWDPWGNRIDEVVVPEAWKLFARAAVEEGLIATAYERAHGEFSRLHQFALVYLFDRSADVYSCPLAMTDGAARTLEVTAEPALRDAGLPRLTSRDPASSLDLGPVDDRAHRRLRRRPVARPSRARRRTGWRLYGTKWFTSATTAQMALTLARPEGNAGRAAAAWRSSTSRCATPHGRLNGIQVNRLKDKLGTRKVPTAELTLDGTLAIPVARPRPTASATSRPMLNVTRTWNAVCAVCGPAARRSRWRATTPDAGVAFGAPLAEKPLHVDTLAGMQAEHEAAFHLAFRAVELLGREETGAITERRSRAAARCCTPIAKLTTAQAGGGGAPARRSRLRRRRLRRGHRPAAAAARRPGAADLGGHHQRALARRPARDRPRRGVAGARRARCAGAPRPAGPNPTLRAPAAAALAAIEHAERWLAEASRRGGAQVEAGARRFALTLGRTLALALLVDHAAWALAHERDPRPAAAARRFARTGVDLLGSDDVESEDAAMLALDRSA